MEREAEGEEGAGRGGKEVGYDSRGKGRCRGGALKKVRLGYTLAGKREGAGDVKEEKAGAEDG